MKKDLFPGKFTFQYGRMFLRCLITPVIFCILSSQLAFGQCSSTINTFPYYEGFEASAVWTIGGNNSSWAWGTPTHPTISSAGSGSKCWCSGGLTGSSYSGSQQAWIESPCFNFSTLNYPWISFKIFWECEYQWDGLVLQYSTNGGSSWSNVGAFGDPINCLNANWFNHSNISNLSQASPKHGWCGRIGTTVGSCSGGNGSGTWVTAKHCLSGLANQSNVKFRFLFGSGTTCNGYDGIAIDDIQIQDAPPNAANFSFSCLSSPTIAFTNLSAQCPTAFSWNFGDPGSGGANTSTAQNPSHAFSAPGTYTVSLTASGPCNAPSTTLIAVSVFSLSSQTIGASCNGFNNGSGTVSIAGGRPAFTYSWLPSGGSASVATGLAAGVYTVQVKDSTNCPANRILTITQPPAITCSLTTKMVTCNGLANGSVSATAANGVAPYTYTWMPMSSNATSLNPLGPGTYSLYINDASNCQKLFPVTITEPAPLNMTFTTYSVSCYGGSNGSVSVLFSGGTPAYTFTWNPQVGSSSLISGLVAGTYSLSMKDANNCTLSGTAAVIQPTSGISGSIFTQTPTCGYSNASATVVASGGNGNYSYNWSPVPGALSVLSGINGGNYSVTVGDSQSNCSITLTTSIPFSNSLSIAITSGTTSCSYSSDGFAAALVSGGLGPYSYTWSPNPGGGQGSNNVFGLSPVAYTLQAGDANNCISTAIFTVQAAPVIGYSLSLQHVSCHGGNNGSVTVMASGGNPSYSYSLFPPLTTGPSANNLIAGTYSLIIRDVNNCTQQGSFTITQPSSPLSAVVNATPVSCYGFANGSASVVASGGTPGYFYHWPSLASQAAGVSGLISGDYSVLVKDQNNCSHSASITLTQPAAPLLITISSTSVSCFGGHDGSISIQCNGGTPGYNYTWTGPAGNAVNISSLSAGIYSLQVLDQNNCVAGNQVSIVQPSQITLSVTTSKFCRDLPGMITAAAIGGSPPFSYNWNGTVSPSHVLSVTLDTTTIYDVFAIDQKGCISSHTLVGIEIPEPLQLLYSPTYSVCQGQTALFNANAIGGDGNYSFVWQPGYLQGPTQNIVPKARQIYTVTVTDGCSARQSGNIQLDYYPVPVSAITFTETGAGCAPLCINFSNPSLESSGIIESYQWNFGDGSSSDAPSPSHCFNKEGYFTVQLSYFTTKGCGGDQYMKEMIQVYPKPLASFTTDKEEIDAYNPTVTFINQSQEATSYNWYFNNDHLSTEKDPSFTFFNPGDQMVVLVAQSELGCSDTLMRTIHIDPGFTFFAPNSFSPNENSVNDIFLPKGIGWNTASFELAIYDRWGQKIFSTNNHEEGWDGKVRGSSVPVENGVYTWKAKLFDTFNQYHEFIGNVFVQK